MYIVYNWHALLNKTFCFLLWLSVSASHMWVHVLGHARWWWCETLGFALIKHLQFKIGVSLALHECVEPLANTEKTKWQLYWWCPQQEELRTTGLPEVKLK